MSQEMTFAQALGEARQIIVQQSKRIKSDLDKVVALQETIASQTASICQTERTLEDQSKTLAKKEEQLQALMAKLGEATMAREQAEAIIDRQGQRLSQSQETISELEKTVAEKTQQLERLNAEIDQLRKQIPTQEDTQALAALSELLLNKKVSVPAVAQRRKLEPVTPPALERTNEPSVFLAGPTAIAA